MKKLKLKIKLSLMRFFGIDEILKEIAKEREELRFNNRLADACIKQHSLLIKEADLFHEEVIQKSRVGLDVHQNYGKSWAIIALGGNPESIRFYSFDEKADLGEMSEFLKHFNSRNRTVDCRRDEEAYFKSFF